MDGVRCLPHVPSTQALARTVICTLAILVPALGAGGLITAHDQSRPLEDLVIGRRHSAPAAAIAADLLRDQHSNPGWTRSLKVSTFYLQQQHVRVASTPRGVGVAQCASADVKVPRYNATLHSIAPPCVA
jgi:hypothetical protein